MPCPSIVNPTNSSPVPRGPGGKEGPDRRLIHCSFSDGGGFDGGLQMDIILGPTRLSLVVSKYVKTAFQPPINEWAPLSYVEANCPIAGSNIFCFMPPIRVAGLSSNLILQALRRCSSSSSRDISGPCRAPEAIFYPSLATKFGLECNVQGSHSFCA